jgi:hypothetical protein
MLATTIPCTLYSRFFFQIATYIRVNIVIVDEESHVPIALLICSTYKYYIQDFHGYSKQNIY